MSRQSRRFAKSRQFPRSPEPAHLPGLALSNARPKLTGRAWLGLVMGTLLAAVLYLLLSQQTEFTDRPYVLAAIPLVVLGIAAFPIWRQHRLRQRRESGIQRMDWSEFQPLLCQLLEQQGYHLSESGNRPGVVDLVVRKNRQTFLVHAKSWKAGKLGLHEVRELYAAMVTRGAPAGILVSGAKFGRSAREFARETQIHLVDGAVLQQWVTKLTPASTRPTAKEAEPVAGELRRPVAMDTQMLPEYSPISDDSAPLVPQCPLCDAPMRSGTSSKGRHAGRQFWGCTRHPQCKGVRRRE